MASCANGVTVLWWLMNSGEEKGSWLGGKAFGCFLLVLEVGWGNLSNPYQVTCYGDRHSRFPVLPVECLAISHDSCLSGLHLFHSGSQ
jgi:hypothetical protein